MKTYTKLFTDVDNKSHFKEEAIPHESEQPLGFYSKKIPVSKMMFRTFKAGLHFNWHNAPKPQYIIYLEGEVEVESSGGETKIFRPGDVLFATDLKGKGHITRTLTSGRSIIITTTEDEIAPSQIIAKL